MHLKVQKFLQNQIRGLAPSPGAYVLLQLGSQVKRLKIFNKSCFFKKKAVEKLDPCG